MIMIIGASHDDILYFDSVLSHKRSEIVFQKYEIKFGKIFNQDVMLVEGAYTNSISSALALYLMDKYYVILTFIVGKCASFSKNFKIGEIAISRKAYFGAVNFGDGGDARLGQVPDFPTVYESPRDVIGYLRNALEQRTSTRYHRCKFISFDRELHRRDELDYIRSGETIFGDEERTVIDTNTAGVALACYILKVPFVSVKVVERLLDEESSIENYYKVLTQYTDLGKAMITCIGDIGRTDILTEVE